MDKIKNSGTRKIKKIDEYIIKEESKMAELYPRPPSELTRRREGSRTTRTHSNLTKIETTNYHK